MEPLIITKIKEIVMMGLDVTNQTICTPDIIERMEAVGNKAGKLFGDLMRFTLKTQYIEFGLEAGPIHDATTIAYLIDPEMFEVKEMFVEVDINRGPCYGRTVCDESNVMKEEPHAKVGTAIDAEAFFELVEECIRKY